MKVVFKFVLLLAFLSAVAWGVFAWWLAPAPEVAPKRPDIPVPVKVVSVETGLSQHVFQGIGVVKPAQAVEVRSKVSGQVQSLLAQEGQWVQKGQPLVQLDPKPFERALRQAQHQLQQNVLKRDKAREDVALYQRLFQQKSVSQQEWRQHQALLNDLELQHAQLLLSLEQAQEQLSDTRLVAPIAGRLGLRRVDEGAWVNAGAPEGLFSITQLQPAEVVFAVSAPFVPALQALRDKPLQVQLLTGAQGQQGETGEVIAIDNHIDSATGALRVKARFANADARLLANQSVRLQLFLETQADALLLNSEAIHYRQQQAVVFVVTAEGRAREVAVTLGHVHNGFTQILSGLQAGDQVVIEGADRVRTGARLHIVR